MCLVIHMTIGAHELSGSMRGSLKCIPRVSRLSSRVSKTWFRFSGTLCLLLNAMDVMLYPSSYQ